MLTDYLATAYGLGDQMRANLARILLGEIDGVLKNTIGEGKGRNFFTEIIDHGR